MNKLKQVEELTYNTQLFDEKFNELYENYTFESEKESYDFIKEHPGLLLILDEYTPCLKKYFPNGIFELTVDIDPEIITWKTLILTVKVDEETFNNGCYEHLTFMRRHFRPLRRELNLMGEIMLMSMVNR
ncbi:hypothetical protein [Methanobrevibacter sp.]|uniref:hypothetical protein n=1 Tax=Methanobrevibacter sp. TaxID=66852 RepID=UPI00386899C2